MIFKKVKVENSFFIPPFKNQISQCTIPKHPVSCIEPGLVFRWMTQRDGMGGRWEGGSGWGIRVHPWRIHVDVWQNQYNIVK